MHMKIDLPVLLVTLSDPAWQLGMAATTTAGSLHCSGIVVGR